MRPLLVVIALLLSLIAASLATHALWWTSTGERASSFRRADWSSAGLLPRDASANPEAVVRVFAARTGRWRGIVAHHSWIVVKERGAPAYTR